ncbi:MAG: lamin tail domain-containing protein [Chthoniobacter sp.]
MKKTLLFATLLAGGILHVTPSYALPGLAITEWMYNPSSTGGEFVEFTNLSLAPINMTGWSFDDSSEIPGSESLSGFGTVAPGESVIFTESTAAVFRTTWGLSASVKIVGGNTDNLGRSDEINLYNASNVLVDRLTFNDQGTGNVAGPRTAGISGRPSSLAAIGANNASAWVLSSVGDIEGSHTSTAGDVGSPGFTSFAVPEPSAIVALIGGVGIVALRRRRTT